MNYIPAKERKKLRVEDEVDFILDRLIFAKECIVPGMRKDCLFLPKDMGPMWMSLHPDIDEISFFHGEDINDPTIVWPMSVGMVSVRYDDRFPYLQCDYWQSATAKSMRGRYRNFGRYNIAWYHGRTIEENVFLSAVTYASWFSGKWMTSQRLKFDQAFLECVRDSGSAPIERFVATGEDDIGSKCALGQSIALTYRYEWGAQFSIGPSARVIVPTTPEGVRELFDDRDKPEDRDRRAALRHWVSQHKRRNRRGSFSKVREHLRGHTEFTWRGFDVRIIPSQFDIEQNENETR